MELLLSKNPMFVDKFSSKEVKDYYSTLANEADEFNIATGFISNDSIVELSNLVKFRNEHKNNIKLNMLIGMNYLDGFTRIQYEAIKDLSSFLFDNKIGKVYVSKMAYFHGKMYSFDKEGNCLAAFIGSSNLGSFVGSTSSYIEADAMFYNKDASYLDDHIKKIIFSLGTDIKEIEPITDFKEPDFTLLNDNSYVRKVPGEYKKLEAHTLGYSINLPLKTEPKSNLNTYFGAGKIKERYSPRNWYEVEYIINKSIQGYSNLPAKDEIFTVVTNDDYKFCCQRQGDHRKNLRTIGDLRILGKWIKGHMEQSGALRLEERVTEKTLQKFGKTKMVLTPTKEGVWLLKME